MAAEHASTNGLTELLLSESVRAPLIAQGKPNHGAKHDGRKLRSLTSPVVSTSSMIGDDHYGEFDRPFSGGNVEPMSPFTAVHHNAFDESGTVINPKRGFMRSLNSPGI